MSRRVSKEGKPINDCDLVSWKMKQRFRALFFAAYHFLDGGEHWTEAAAILHQRVVSEVSSHPILARTIHGEMNGWSLLQVFCEKTSGFCRETIQFLIDTNPHMILWRHWRSTMLTGRVLSIHMIAENMQYCKMMPWIAEHYPWVFEHSYCQKRPPHFEMLRNHVHGECDVETARRFYELYPQGLREKERFMSFGCYPLFVCFKGGFEPDAEIFIWIAQQYPEAVYHQPVNGYNLLYDVCFALAAEDREETEDIPYTCTPNMAKICRFLICEHADLLHQIADDNGNLPIHMLTRRCNRPLVQEMILVMVKACPKCVLGEAGTFHPKLATIPLLNKCTHPLLTNWKPMKQ